MIPTCFLTMILIYQMFITTYNYIQFHTDIKIKIKQIEEDNIKIPAFSMCLNSRYVMEYADIDYKSNWNQRNPFDAFFQRFYGSKNVTIMKRLHENYARHADKKQLLNLLTFSSFEKFVSCKFYSQYKNILNFDGIDCDEITEVINNYNDNGGYIEWCFTYFTKAKHLTSNKYFK